MCKTIFTNWFEDEFSKTMLHDHMVNTVEDSPYHREPNVWEHTKMVVESYTDQSPNVWNKYDLMSAIMCAFHDTGKPMSEEVLVRDNGTQYRRYTNHDVMSGNIFIDYVCSNRDHELLSGLSDIDIYNVWVMIAYHMPYKLSSDRVELLHTHLNYYGLVNIFTRGVFADAKGRIADNQNKTESSSKSWCDNFRNLETKHENTDESRWVILLCGCSGIGKTTYSTTLMKKYGTDAAYHSMDSLRLELYSEDYKTAFQMSVDDKEFGNKVTKDFNEKIKNYKYTIVDNTNLSWKRRKQYLNAKATGGKAIVFVADYATVLDRQTNRSDKVIPSYAVERMYYSHRPVIIGEVDAIDVQGL